MGQSDQYQQQTPLKIIAAIPCFNTASSIGDVVSGATYFVAPVIVIDDGSSDNTAEIARAAGAQVISHGMNKGYGEAIKSCFKAGRANGADILITLDGDGQHNPDEIQKIVASILNREADIVIGSRFLTNQTDMPGYRKFGIKVITLLFNLGAKTKVRDAQSGFRAYSKRVLNTISPTETGMSVSVEILIRARTAGFGIREVATSCRYHSRSSTKNPVVHGLEVALSVVRLRAKNLLGRLAVAAALDSAVVEPVFAYKVGNRVAAGKDTLKIVFINPSQNDRYAQPPMGLALLAAILEKEGYQVAILDANALGIQPEEVAPLVAGADVIGLTAMTPTIGAAASIARSLKQANPNLTIILGGAHATLLPEETLANNLEIDVIVRGEGEKTILKLLRALEDKQTLDDIPGISYRKDSEIISNPVMPENVDMDTLPFLAYHLLPWQRYRPHPPHGRSYPFTAIITSRGCPYRCSYCSKPVFGSKFRAQTPQRVAAEVAYYAENFGVREIAFYDDVFTLDKKRAYAIADELIKAEIKIHWTCETRVNLVDRELLQHMKRAGCYAIAYGIESASPDILKVIDKGISLKQVEEAVRMTQEVGLQTIGYFMLGSPGESPETIGKTIAFAKKLKIDFAQFSVTTPFPGTRLYEIYLNERRSENIPWESFVYAGTDGLVTPVFENNQLSRSALNYWVKRAYKEFYLRPSYLWQRIRHTTSIGDLKVGIKGLSMLSRI